VWEAKDLDALGPLIQAFHFPRERALAIFSGWKGIIFYAFEYESARERREDFARWLRHDAVPKEIMSRDMREWLEMSRRGVVARLRAHWVEIDGVLQTFDGVYGDFVGSLNPGGFVDFLMNAADIYWRLGDSLSKISHAINCWDVATKNYAGRRLPAERLEMVLALLQAVLAPALPRSAVEAA
jgi:hypothetical protein